MVTEHGKSVYAWGIGGWNPITLTPNAKDAQADGWTRYNFTGYEGRDAVRRVQGADRPDGRRSARSDASAAGGRLWENNGDNGQYGTTMALMLLPHWTDGCIDSDGGPVLRGQSAPRRTTSSRRRRCSSNSSNPVRELRYDNNDAAKGVPDMQTLGVKYLMVRTEKAKAQADARPELTKRRRGRAVEHLPGRRQRPRRAARPCSRWSSTAAAATSANATSSSARAGSSTATTGRRCRPTTARRTGSGSTSPSIRAAATAWRPGDRAARSTSSCRRADRRQGRSRRSRSATCRLGEQDLRFDVDQIGVPVLVKVSYFPNWQVSGAEGPYRIAPNMMVVVPTSTDVQLTYGRSPLDYFAYLLTFVGIGC